MTDADNSVDLDLIRQTLADLYGMVDALLRQQEKCCRCDGKLHGASGESLNSKLEGGQ